MTTQPEPSVSAVTPDQCCSDGAHAVTLEGDPDETLSRLCRALGHPARVFIVRYLLSRETCMAGEIAEVLPLAPSTVSQHLKTLKAAGLIHGEVDGPRRCYCVESAVLDQVRTLIDGLATSSPR